MNPALLTLIRLQTHGFLRRIGRSAASPRQAIFLVVGLAVIVLWLGPVLISAAIQTKHQFAPRVSAERFRAVAPVALLGICLLTIVSS
ncbi:MAG TPA: hypothetical protein VN541_22725, partial [Tepidisphaeraceae bacterium]|nr:hypothetical protein [Tepidisphaeraceae bacterium]